MSEEVMAADALLTANADLSRQIGELHTTIGYQDAMIVQLRAGLDQIDRHVVGACASDTGGMPEPCEECGEMREIAAQALAATRAAAKPLGAQRESELGAAHAEIARLEEALTMAGRMKTITGARRIVADALGG